MPRLTPPLPPLLGAAGGLHLADQLAMAALPLSAVLALGAGSRLVGLLLAAQAAAWLLVSLPAGVLVDRLPRRALLVGAGLLGAAGLAVALPGAALGVAWLLGLGGFLASAGTVLFVLTATAAVPALAGPAGLAATNARIELARAGVTLAAPALVGLLAGAGWLPAAYGLALLAALLAAGAAALLPRGLGAVAAPGPRPPVVALLREGAGFVAGHPLLRGIALCAIAWNFGFFALLTGFVPLALGPLGLDPARLGLAQAGYGVGLLAGAALAPLAIRRCGPRAILLAGPGLSLGAPALLLAAGPGGVALPFLAQLLVGFGPMLWLVCQTGIRQTVTPAAMLGRVGATVQVAIYGVRPLGALAAGAAAAAWGPGAAIALAGAAFLLAFAVVATGDLARLRAMPASGQAGFRGRLAES